MGLQFDANNNLEDFTIVLSTREYNFFGEINNIKRESVHVKMNLNGADELSFEVCKTLDDKTERLWDNITNYKLVWVKELDEFFEINVTVNDSVDGDIKTITGTSLCEAELGQVNLYGLEINTESDIERDDYVITKFYNKDNPKGSLLDRVLDKVPHYSIKHVDDSLVNMQRSFSVDGTSIYDFLTGDCANEFNCFFIFDSTDRTISVFDLYTVCKDCGYRGEYDEVCPKCGSDNLRYYGEDTTILVDKENLTDSIQFTTATDSVKNCFKLEAGDDNMTAAVKNINPNGSDYLIYISDEQKSEMPSKLVKAINDYDSLYDSYMDEYESLIEDIYNVIDDIHYYESEMMPTVENSEVTSSTEAAKLTASNLSPLSLSTISSSTSKATVETALKNYAKVYVKTGYVKLEINESEFTVSQSGESYIGTWKGNFKVTNYSDETDISLSDVITVTVNDDYENFINQKVLKSISSKEDDDVSIFD